MTFEEYKALNGNLDEAEFNELEPLVAFNIEGYIAYIIPKWKVKDSLEEYNLDNLGYILRMQIDFISSCGGINAMMGKSDFDIRSVATSGITMQMGTSSNVRYHDGVPLAPIVSSLLVKELRKKGYMSLAVW